MAVTKGASSLFSSASASLAADLKSKADAPAKGAVTPYAESSVRKL